MEQPQTTREPKVDQLWNLINDVQSSGCLYSFKPKPIGQRAFHFITEVHPLCLLYIWGAQIQHTEPTATNRERATPAFKCYILSFGGCVAARDETLRRHKAMRG